MQIIGYGYNSINMKEGFFYDFKIVAQCFNLFDNQVT